MSRILYICYQTNAVKLGGEKANEYILNQEYAYSLCLKVEREYIEVFIVDLYKQNISYDKIEEKAISAEKILKVIENFISDF